MGASALRTLLLIGGWVVVLALAALHVLCYLGVSRPVFLDWAWAFTPYVYLPAWIALILAGVMGSRSLAAAAAVVCIAHVAWLVPAVTGRPAVVAADAPRLRVASSNIEYSNPNVLPILDELIGLEPDVIVLQEVTPRALPSIITRLSRRYTHRVTNPERAGFGSAIFSKLPLRDQREISLSGVPMLTALVEVGGRSVRIWDVHTRAPTLGFRREVRDEQLAQLERERLLQKGPLIAVGDYNATIWHRSFRHLLARDLTDAAGAVGRGRLTTWKGAPLFETTLDHALVSDDFAVLGFDTGIGRGSDHRPIVTDLALRTSGR